MSIASTATNRRSVVLAFAFMALLAGLQTFFSMSRREDPKLLIRNAIVEARWPGASAEKVEDLVTETLEDVIYGIEEVDELSSTSQTGYSRINITLEDSVTEVDQVWDEVRAKVDKVRAQLPTGCGKPNVNSDFGDVTALCLALYQDTQGGPAPYSYRDLELYADEVERVLKEVPSVGQVTIYGVPREVITLAVDAAEWSQLGLTTDQLAQALDQRNLPSSGVQITTADSIFPLNTTGELLSVEEINDVVVAHRADGLPVRIRDLPITVSRGIQDPPNYLTRFISPEERAERALLVGLTMKSGQNIVEMGEQIEAAVEGMRGTLLPPDVKLTRINDIPRQVSGLVTGFVINLWEAILIVLLVALLMMGWRAAVVMATAVPLCMISAFAVVRLFGVELEQFSIASLIIALGMIVDNAIVVSDNALVLMRQGKSRLEAVAKGADGLAIPMLTSTLTTVAAFVPMLSIPGGSGEYMRSLPIVISVTLLLSYAVAMTVTPVMCYYVLRPPKEKGGKAQSESKPGIYERLIHWCLGHKLVTLGAAATALIGALSLVPSIGSQFFPQGERDQLFIHVNLAEGTSLEATLDAIAQVEDVLLETSATEIDGEQVERLANASSFVGFGGPRLMLTMSPEAAVSSYGMVLVNTTDAQLSVDWGAELREALADVEGARIDVRIYSLGPPLTNPVEFRLGGPEIDVLRSTAEEMLTLFRATPGAQTPSHDWGNSGFQVEVAVDNDLANLAGVSNASISSTLRDLYDGGALTTYREGDHTVEVKLQLLSSERSQLSSLSDVYVDGQAGKVPLEAISELVTGWQPAVIARYNKRRTVTVGCQVAPGFLGNSITAELNPQLEEILEGLPPGYELEIGGEAEQTADSQKDISSALQISMVLILLVLITQYNSIIKPFIVLLTVPLSLIGALLGLYLTGWPLGFMPSLGIVSLAGVVINNAIILIDFIETTVREGVPLRDAVARAGRARMKPIVLTTLTTIGGLIPLALFGGPMWAGMSYAMMGGLIISTGLTLLVIPTVYVLCAERLGMQVTS